MKYSIAFFLFLFCLSCGNDQPSLKPLNLLKYGVPISINAPDSAKVKTSDMGIFKDISVVDGDDFSIQIFASKATTIDIKQIKADQLESIKKELYFSKLIREEDQGFVFENNIDSLFNYSFRYIQVVGDQEIIFQPGMGGLFSQEEAERMYEAVKPVK